jgi:two-component system chemotaxis response regulator CheY
MFDLNTRILVVDDMMTMRKLVSKCLKEIGFTNISEAADGSIAWQDIMTTDNPYGLIVSDWNMPNCSGLDLLKRVRVSEKHKHLPFVLVTAESEQHQILEALKAGVSNYVIKPFTPVGLKEKLEAVHQKITAKAA